MLATREDVAEYSSDEDQLQVKPNHHKHEAKHKKSTPIVIESNRDKLTSTTLTPSSSTTSTEKLSQSSIVNNREEKIQEYKHIKPLSVDDISKGGGRISYPSLSDILSASNNDSWMSMVLPSAPPLIEDEQDQVISYPHLSDLSNQTLEYILPPIVKKEEEKEKAEPILPPLVIHKIQEGETLISISIKYGVTEEAIKLKNRMMDSDLTLYNKIELLIPEPTQLPPEDSFKKKELTEEEKRKMKRERKHGL
ncbi:predicted protein [Naegleria gruberi]|uniref:Predicted protein n=1 Tax=Naegleria gruberi TaxID=5762 RepID=D2VM68_NAEGR|nr:uncharacterized protein NAEGRDRAFT_70029 [Naegleria gruberi]EFC41933.1 predicted protein [Naegleria gruberi]|eukprot:XP_002674677.1 predicted protein [Naegleria gruberi strain NEG-M]